MRILWSVPVLGERLGSSRGDLVRAAALVDALRRDGHDVRVVQDALRAGSSIAVDGYRRVVKRLVPRRLALVARDLGRARHFARHGGEVARQAAEHGAELIVETQVGFSDSGARAAEATGLPLVLDDCAPTREELEAGCGVPALARRALRRGLRVARLVAAPSPAIARELVAEGADAGRVRVVGNGYDDDLFARADRAAFRAKAGLGRRRVVVFAGSFQPWHRVDVLVRAVATLPGDDVLLLLLGDGPGRKAALDLARELGIERRLLAPGSVPPSEVPSWLAASDVGVLPGTSDYMHPMKLVEYAAAALPRVAPDVLAAREVVSDGVDGLLVAPADAKSLADALSRLLEDRDLRRRLGHAARQRVAGETWLAKARLLLAPPT